jgi:hypothetical protein
VHVEQHHVRRACFDRADRSLGLGGRSNYEAASLEGSPDGAKDLLFVIDYEN